MAVFRSKREVKREADISPGTLLLVYIAAGRSEEVVTRKEYT